MSQDIKAAYKKGGGSELLRRENMPPKMAHIASSSRFIYETFKSSPNEKVSKIIKNISSEGIFTFEHKLPIINGFNEEITEANMDGTYISNSEKHGVFFEAKCHELFDSHSIVFSYTYFLKGYLTKKEKQSLQLKNNQIKFKIKKSALGFNKSHKYIHFNIKKFLCDLFELSTSKSAKKELIYYYNKNKIMTMLHKDELKEQINIFINSYYVSGFLKRNNIEINFKEDNNYHENELFKRNTLSFESSYLLDGYLNGNANHSLQLDNKYIEVEIDKTVFGIPSNEKLYLDIKQFICHLFSISSTKLLTKDLVFLYFKPKDLNSGNVNFEKEYNYLENQFSAFCNNNNIARILKEFNISTRLVYATNNSFEDTPVFETRCLFKQPN